MRLLIDKDMKNERTMEISLKFIIELFWYIGVLVLQKRRRKGTLMIFFKHVPVRTGFLALSQVLSNR